MLGIGAGLVEDAQPDLARLGEELVHMFLDVAFLVVVELGIERRGSSGVAIALH